MYPSILGKQKLIIHLAFTVYENTMFANNYFIKYNNDALFIIL
jgi:hypothetical protein